MRNFKIQFYRITLCNLFLYFSFLLFLNGCFSVKPTTTKSGKKYFETFFVGENGSQYFIKPLVFEGKQSKEYLFVDLTFRYKNEVKDSAIANISIKSSKFYKTIDSLKLSNGNFDIMNKEIDLLFNEKSGENFISRFTTKIPLTEIKQLFNNTNWDFTFYNESEIKEYQTPKRTEKAITVIKETVFVIM